MIIESATETLLEFRNVFRRYGSGESEVNALNGVNLSIADGAFVAMMGPSGSGKSTCLNILGGLDTPTEGQYLFRETDVGTLSLRERAVLRRQQIGFIFQSFNLLGRTTALENVELPLIYQRVDAKSRRERALSALDRVGLSNRVHHTPAELSGGQKQRVAIARAIVGEPSLILADEPTGNLDSSSGADVLQLLVELNQQHGVAIVLVTHEPEMAKHAHSSIRFLDGSISSIEQN
jgi:putative ABC transport system ATP-binding protein